MALERCGTGGWIKVFADYTIGGKQCTDVCIVADSYVVWNIAGISCGGGRAEQRIPGAPVNVGQQYFVQYCACVPRHGWAGQRAGGAGTAHPPADFTRIAQRRGGQFADAEVAALIDGRAMVRAHGSRDMPVWGLHFGKSSVAKPLAKRRSVGMCWCSLPYLKSVQQ